jgi:hypothetical protein
MQELSYRCRTRSQRLKHCRRRGNCPVSEVSEVSETLRKNLKGVRPAVSNDLNACEIRITDFTDFTDGQDVHLARHERGTPTGPLLTEDVAFSEPKHGLRWAWIISKASRFAIARITRPNLLDFRVYKKRARGRGRSNGE